MENGTDGPDPTQDPTIVDQPVVPAAAAGAAGAPPTDPPGDVPGADGQDEDDREWYQKPAVLAGIGAAVVLAGLLIGFLLFGGDDDGKESAGTTSTTASTTTTSTTTTAPPADDPVTPAPDEPDTPDEPDEPEDNPDADLAEARANWGANDGRAYAFSYFVGGEGGEQRYCVSGTAGDPDSVQDAVGACGDDLSPGGMGVEAWFDFIEGSIAAGTFVSAEYDPTNGYPVSALFELLDTGSYRVDFVTFNE